MSQPDATQRQSKVMLKMFQESSANGGSFASKDVAFNSLIEGILAEVCDAFPPSFDDVAKFIENAVNLDLKGRPELQDFKPLFVDDSRSFKPNVLLMMRLE
eukprot:8272680-Pyramimonas_sp.AAC.1